MMHPILLDNSHLNRQLYEHIWLSISKSSNFIFYLLELTWDACSLSKIDTEISSIEILVTTLNVSWKWSIKTGCHHKILSLISQVISIHDEKSWWRRDIYMASFKF